MFSRKVANLLFNFSDILMLADLKFISVLLVTGFTVLFVIYRVRNSLLPTSRNFGKLTRMDTDEEYTKCKSPGCVRCKNYKQSTEYLADKLDEYLKGNYPKEDESKTLKQIEPYHYQRLKLSVTKGEAHHNHNLRGTELSFQKPVVFQLSSLPTKPWYEKGEICEKEVNLLQDSFPTIWEEFTQVYKDLLNGTSTGWRSNSVPTGQWSVFHLYNQGKKVTSNCLRCPGTSMILEKLDSFMSNIVFGNATFTVLQAETHITEHYGPCNLRIRCHLGLQIPPHCFLTVAKQTRHWTEEECLLFDDSYLHKAKHDGLEKDGPRIVFMVDLWHPEITEEEKSALEYMFAI